MRRIAQTSSGVSVSTDRGTVQAKQVIVAVPPPLALGIKFSPLLPARRRQLLQHMPMGQLMKCDAVYETPFWRAKGLSGSGVATYGAVRAMFDNSPNDAAVGVLLGFVGGSTLETYGAKPLAERRAAVLEGFALFVGKEALTPIEYVEQDWTKEPWTMGSPIASPTPGAITVVRLDHPRAGRPRPLGRHRDVDVLVRLHGRRRARRRARRDGGRGPPLTLP